MAAAALHGGGVPRHPIVTRQGGPPLPSAGPARHSSLCHGRCHRRGHQFGIPVAATDPSFLLRLLFLACPLQRVQASPYCLPSSKDNTALTAAIHIASQAQLTLSCNHEVHGESMAQFTQQTKHVVALPHAMMMDCPQSRVAKAPAADACIHDAGPGNPCT